MSEKTILDAELADLASRINNEHRLCEQAVREGIEHALLAGQLLNEAKDKCPHGSWLGWLAVNCEVAERTAQVYMRVARNWQILEAKAQRIADLSLNDAIALLTEPRDVPIESETLEELDEPTRVVGIEEVEYPSPSEVSQGAKAEVESPSERVREHPVEPQVSPIIGYPEEITERTRLHGADGPTLSDLETRPAHPERPRVQQATALMERWKNAEGTQARVMEEADRMIQDGALPPDARQYLADSAAELSERLGWWAKRATGEESTDGADGID